jgi:chromosome segregation ATPase
MQTRDLFHLQTELIDMKVDMAVSRTIDRVVDQISALRGEMNSQIHELRCDMVSLKGEMNSQIHELKDNMSSQIHELRHEMRDEFSSLKTRVNAVETKLKIVNAPKKEIRSNFISYGFKAVWTILGLAASVILSYFAIHFF